MDTKRGEVTLSRKEHCGQFSHSATFCVGTLMRTVATMSCLCGFMMRRCRRSPDQVEPDTQDKQKNIRTNPEEKKKSRKMKLLNLFRKKCKKDLHQKDEEKIVEVMEAEEAPQMSRRKCYIVEIHLQKRSSESSDADSLEISEQVRQSEMMLNQDKKAQDEGLEEKNENEEAEHHEEEIQTDLELLDLRDAEPQEKELNQPVKVHQQTEVKVLTEAVEERIKSQDVKLLELKDHENVPDDITEEPIKKKKQTRRGTRGRGRKINYKKNKKDEAEAPEEQIKADVELQEINEAETEKGNVNENINLQLEDKEREEASEENMDDMDVDVLEVKAEKEKLIRPMKTHLEKSMNEDAGAPKEKQRKPHLDVTFLDVKEGEAELFSHLLQRHLETNPRIEVVASEVDQLDGEEDGLMEKGGVPKEQIKPRLDLKFLDVRDGEADFFSQFLGLRLETNPRIRGAHEEKLMETSDLMFLDVRDGEEELFKQLLGLHPEEKQVGTSNVKFLDVRDGEEELFKQLLGLQLDISRISPEEQLEDLDYVLKILKNRDVDAKTVHKTVMLRLQKYQRN